MAKGRAGAAHSTGVSWFLLVLMKAISTAETWPIASVVDQKLSESSPRTPRYSSSLASAGGVCAASLRIAQQRWRTVAVKVTSGCCTRCSR